MSSFGFPIYFPCYMPPAMQSPGSLPLMNQFLSLFPQLDHSNNEEKNIPERPTIHSEEEQPVG